MKFDEAYRSAYTKIVPDDSFLEQTKIKMKSQKKITKKRLCVQAMKAAAVCCALFLAVFGLYHFMGLFSCGSAAPKSTAAAQNSNAAADTMVGSQQSPSSIAGKLTAGAVPSSAPASSGSSGYGAALEQHSGNVAIPTYQIYGDGIYLGVGDISKSQIGEKVESIWSGQTCYAVRGVSSSKSIAVDYNGVLIRYNYAASCLIPWNRGTYRLESGWGASNTDTLGEKIESYQKFILYRDTKNSSRIWVDIGPIVQPEISEECLVAAQKIS